ncbi:MAG: MmpS family transport accessory protein [Pseudonocardiaceae bacterium]
MSAPQNNYPEGWKPPSLPEAKKRHRKWPWIVGGVVAIIVIIAIAAPKANSGHKGTSLADVTVPPPQSTSGGTVPSDLVGKTASDATAELASAGFSAGVNFTSDDGTCDASSFPSLPPNCGTVAVTDVSPGSGTVVDTQTIITLNLAASGQPTEAAVPVGPVTHHVVYKVVGSSGTGSITYTTDGSTQIAQDNGASLPWTKSFDIPDGMLNLYQVSAQNGGGGSITCTITVDGQQVSHQTSTGDYAIASCSSTH